MKYWKIGDYGLIGNRRTAALVSRCGSIDWLCMPHLDSPSLFASLLDPERGGQFDIAPAGEYGKDWDSAQSYLGNSNILQTLYRSALGEASVTDFLAIPGPSGFAPLVRIIDGTTGHMRFSARFSPRLAYGEYLPDWTRIDNTTWQLSHGDHRLVLRSNRLLFWQDEVTSIPIEQGEQVWITLEYLHSSETPSETQNPIALKQECADYWHQWLQRHAPPDSLSKRSWRNAYTRSILAVGALTSLETGLVAEAPTTSLPTRIFANTARDGRLVALATLPMQLELLLRSQQHDEATVAMNAVLESIPQFAGVLNLTWSQPAASPPPQILNSLAGYRGTPPRSGQDAHDTTDIVACAAVILDALLLISRYTGRIERQWWEPCKVLLETCLESHRRPDYNLATPLHGSQYHTIYKLLCWMAADRGIKVAQRYGFPGDVEKWKSSRQELREEIITGAYDDSAGIFTGSYSSDAPDLAALLMPLIGFLPAEDPRVKRTIMALESNVLDNESFSLAGITTLDPQIHNVLLLCRHWYINDLILQQRFGEAADQIDQITSTANPLGLFGEAYDQRFCEITGNFPATSNHIALATTLINFAQAQESINAKTASPPERRLGIVFRSQLMNPKRSSETPNNSADGPQLLQEALNELRREFYDPHDQIVDYHRIRGSKTYKRFLDAMSALRDFDPGALVAEQEKAAFWLNAFNAAVIHGISELGLHSSVKDVPLFFDRIQYKVGTHTFTPSDIEHGILRGNAPLPGKRRNKFAQRDPRRKLALSQLDPRVHFAVFLGTKSAPYLDVYTPERYDVSLNEATAMALNACAPFQNKRRVLVLPGRMHWYRHDFPSDDAALIQLVAPYYNDDSIKEWLVNNAKKVSVEYASFDWRLNN